MRASIDRNDAHRCVYLLPRVRGLRRAAAAEAGRLLRVLFLRLGSLSPDPGEPVMLCDAGHSIGAEASSQRCWRGVSLVSVGCANQFLAFGVAQGRTEV